MSEQPHTPSAAPLPPADSDSREEAPPVEHETERWKHRVEAEARRELEHEIRGVSRAGRS